MKTLVAVETIMSHRLTMGNVCHHHNCFSFAQMFLKLADKVDMDKIYDNRSDH